MGTKPSRCDGSDGWGIKTFLLPRRAGSLWNLLVLVRCHSCWVGAWLVVRAVVLPGCHATGVVARIMVAVKALGPLRLASPFGLRSVP